MTDGDRSEDFDNVRKLSKGLMFLAGFSGRTEVKFIREGDMKMVVLVKSKQGYDKSYHRTG